MAKGTAAARRRAAALASRTASTTASSTAASGVESARSRNWRRRTSSPKSGSESNASEAETERLDDSDLQNAALITNLTNGVATERPASGRGRKRNWSSVAKNESSSVAEVDPGVAMESDDSRTRVEEWSQAAKDADNAPEILEGTIPVIGEDTPDALKDEEILPEDAGEEPDVMDAADEGGGQEEVDETEEAEQAQQRKEAMAALTSIELKFAKLRDKLFDERITELQREVTLIEDGSHPELASMTAQIESKRNERLSLANVHLKYRLENIDSQYRAAHFNICSMFLQQVRDHRESVIAETGQQWYQVQRERQLIDRPFLDYGFTVPAHYSLRVRHRAAYNHEVSLLSGMAKYVGFPGAPTIDGASPDECRMDLQAMGIVSAQPAATLSDIHMTLEDFPHGNASEHTSIPSISINRASPPAAAGGMLFNAPSLFLPPLAAPSVGNLHESDKGSGHIPIKLEDAAAAFPVNSAQHRLWT